MLTIVLPNGSLRAMVEKIFAEAGIDLATVSPRKHWVQVAHPLVSKVVWLKAKDIPEVLYEGRLAQVGITGSDCYMEWRLNRLKNCVKKHGRVFRLKNLRRFRFGKSGFDTTKIALVRSRGDDEDPYLRHRSGVVTEFPNWTGILLAGPVSEGWDIVGVNGSVEAYVSHHYGFGVTRVETGCSLKENNLEIVRVLAISMPSLYLGPRIMDQDILLAQSLANLFGKALASLERKEVKK